MNLIENPVTLSGGESLPISCSPNKLAPKPHLRSAPLLEDPASEDPATDSGLKAVSLLKQQHSNSHVINHHGGITLQDAGGTASKDTEVK